MATLNTAQSIVDYLRTQNKPSDFNSRKTLYDSSGLSGAFGDYRGTAEQNTTLLKKLSSQQQAQQQPLDPLEEARRTGIAYKPEEKTPKDVIADTTPSTIQTIYDLALSDEEKAAEAATAESTMALAGETARASQSLQRDVNTLNRTAAEGIFDLASQGKKVKSKIGEQAAGFGGANSGATQKSQAEVDQEVQLKQDRVKAKLGDSLYNQFSDFEQKYGTEFLSKLSIPEAESFVKLPVAVRGIVMQNYQEAIEKAQATASKNAISTLEKLGYTVVGGQIVQTLTGRSADRSDEAAIRAEEAAVRSDRRLELAEAASVRAEEASNRAARAASEPKKGTQTEREEAEWGVTKDQALKGAALAEIPVEDFKKLSLDEKNFFINRKDDIEATRGAIDAKLGFKEDGTSSQKQDESKRSEMEGRIASTNYPAPVKDSLTKYLNRRFAQLSPASKGGLIQKFKKK